MNRLLDFDGSGVKMGVFWGAESISGVSDLPSLVFIGDFATMLFFMQKL